MLLQPSSREQKFTHQTDDRPTMFVRGLLLLNIQRTDSRTENRKPFNIAARTKVHPTDVQRRVLRALLSEIEVQPQDNRSIRQLVLATEVPTRTDSLRYCREQKLKDASQISTGNCGSHANFLRSFSASPKFIRKICLQLLLRRLEQK